jgi:hypothetical protein
MRTKIVLAAVLAVGLAVMALSACESPTAQREAARAERIRAEGESYERQRAADTAAASERAAVRQMERDAAHQRALEMLPVIVVLVGAVLLAGLAVLVVWDGRNRSPAADPALWYELRRLEAERAERERLLWHAIAAAHRGKLSGGDRGEVSVYPDQTWP